MSGDNCIQSTEHTLLNLDPWWRSTLPLNDAVHEELLTSDEGVSLFYKLLQRLTAALYSVESPFLFSPLCED